MTTKWKQISEAQARQHPLYGVRGWLLFYLISVALGLFSLLAAYGSLPQEDDFPHLGKIKFILFLLLVGCGTIVWFGFKKSRNFRTLAISISWGQVVAVFTLMALSPEPSATGGLVFSTMLSTAVWTTYLHKSRRTRVTYEHSVSTDDPFLTGPTPVHVAVSTQASPTYQVSASLSLGRTTGERAPAPRTSASMSADTEPTEAAWAKALAEYEGSERRQGVYAKYFAQTGGDEAAAKAMYIKQRAEELQTASIVLSASQSAAEAASAAALIKPFELDTPTLVESKPSEAHALFVDESAQAVNAKFINTKPAYNMALIIFISIGAVILFLAFINVISPKQVAQVNEPQADSPPVAAVSVAIPEAAPPTALEAMEALYAKKSLNGVLRVDAKTSAKPWFSQSIQHKGRDYLVHFIEHQELDEEGNPLTHRFAEATIGAVTYTQENGQWLAISRQRSLFTIGYWGDAPELSLAKVMTLSSGDLILQFPATEGSQGSTTTYVSLLGFAGTDWAHLGNAGTAGNNLGACGPQNAVEGEAPVECWSYTAQLVPTEVKSGVWPPLKLAVKGTWRDNETSSVFKPGTLMLRFDGESYKMGPAGKPAAATAS